MASSANMSQPISVDVPSFEWASLFGWIERYLEKTKSYSSLRLIVEFTCVSFVLKLLLVILIGIFMGPMAGLAARKILETQRALSPFFLINMILLAPIQETAMFQWAPIAFLSRYTSRTSLIVSTSAILFALAHINPFHAAAVLPVGFILGWVYVMKRQESNARAFWMTTGLHMLHNAVCLLLTHICTRIL